MNPVEFVLWMNGAAELVGDQPPTPEQWATMRGKLGETVGGLVAARLLERAEETLRADERKNAMEQMFGYQAQVDLAAKRMRYLANDPSVGIISEVPETAEPRNPGLLNRIFGKATT